MKVGRAEDVVEVVVAPVVDGAVSVGAPTVAVVVAAVGAVAATDVVAGPADAGGRAAVPDGEWQDAATTAAVMRTAVAR